MTHQGGTSATGSMPGVGVKFRNVMTLQQEHAATDSWDAPSSTWANVDTEVRADIKVKGGVEVTQSGQQVATRSIEIRTRYRNDITLTPQMRFVYDGRYFNITATYDADGFRKVLVCQCLENAG